MRLFGKVNSLIDRFDRAAWLTPPFDFLLIPVLCAERTGEVEAEIREFDVLAETRMLVVLAENRTLEVTCSL